MSNRWRLKPKSTFDSPDRAKKIPPKIWSLGFLELLLQHNTQEVIFHLKKCLLFSGVSARPSIQMKTDGLVHKVQSVFCHVYINEVGFSIHRHLHIRRRHNPLEEKELEKELEKE